MSAECHFVDGRAFSAPGEAQREVAAPWDGRPLASVPVGGAAAVEAAVEAATRAFAAWRRTPLDARIACVDALRGRIEAGRQELEALLVDEVGKTIRDAQLEVANLLAAFAYFRDEAPKRLGDVALAAGEHFSPRVQHEPLGVVAAITPFNFPIQLLSWKLCPAVLSGCSLVCKPDPRTPLSTLRLARWAAEVGWPPGLFNVVHGDGATGARLVEHPGVAKVAFTGSVEAGRAVYRSAAAGIKRVTLELGGCSPLLVCRDAELERWMDALLKRAFYNAGQYCFRINRALVERSRYGEFLDGFARAASKLVVGDPADPRTDLGPLIDRPALEKVVGRIEEAERRGARVLVDGRSTASGDGSLVGATLLADVPAEAEVMGRETFGPVVAVAPFEDLDEAIAAANATPYGLAAFALTRDPETGERLSRELDAGTVWINAVDASSLELPFGGAKQSGVGIEKSRWAFDEYLQRRAVYFGFPAASHR